MYSVFRLVSSPSIRQFFVCHSVGECMGLLFLGRSLGPSVGGSFCPMVDWYVPVGPLDGPLVCWSFVRLDPQLVSSLVISCSLGRSLGW